MLVLEDMDHVMPHVSDAQEQVQEEGNHSINKTQVKGCRINVEHSVIDTHEYEAGVSTSYLSTAQKLELCFILQVFRDILRVARCQEAQVLVIATARNKHELNRELLGLTSQGTHTFDRVLEIEPLTLVSGN